MTLVLPHEAAYARELRRDMARDIVWFTCHYFRDLDGERFKLAPFHIEMLRMLASDAERVILLEPAGFGKTTHTLKHYPAHIVSWNPNAQILFGSKNSTDAEARLSTLKSEMEGNEEWINDFGPFVGDLWREDQINVARRTISANDPTINTFGAGSSIIGKRATHLIADDLVTIENSGPNVETETRENVKTKWNDGAKKVGHVGRRLYIRMVNTVVDMRDLIHDLGAKDGAMPEDPAVTNWESDKHYYVIRRPALDETSVPKRSLWPEMRSVESLEAERAEDLLSFLRRMQNMCLDPGTLSFRREWFFGVPNDPEIPGCLDYHRVLGERPTGPGVPSLTGAGAYDPTSGLSDDAAYCAWTELWFDKMAGDGKTFYVTDLARFRATLPVQEDFITGRHREHNLAITHIEDNFAQAWILQLFKIKSMVLAGYRIEGYNTNVKGKYDPDTGVLALAGMIKGGKFRFPYGDAKSRELVNILIGEFLGYPQGATKDMVMALWMAKLAADKVSGSRLWGVIEQTINPYLMRHGINIGTLDRFYPPRRIG